MLMKTWPLKYYRLMLSPYLISSQETKPKFPTWDDARYLYSEINEREAASLDKIPCDLLKLTADVVAPSVK